MSKPKLGKKCYICNKLLVYDPFDNRSLCCLNKDCQMDKRVKDRYYRINNIVKSNSHNTTLNVKVRTQGEDVCSNNDVIKISSPMFLYPIGLTKQEARELMSLIRDKYGSSNIYFNNLYDKLMEVL